MTSYSIPKFGMRGEIMFDDNYSQAEYLNYLQKFGDLEFNSPRIIKSMMATLAIPSINRVCNILLYEQTLDELESFPNGKMPGSIGFLQLTLWKDKGPEIESTFV